MGPTPDISKLPRPILRDRSEDHLRDECGIFSVVGHEEAANLTYLGLYALQHRGQEGAGIVCSDGGNLNAHRGVGLVADVFKPHKLRRLKGDIAIGDVRYSLRIHSRRDEQRDIYLNAPVELVKPALEVTEIDVSCASAVCWAGTANEPATLLADHVSGGVVTEKCLVAQRVNGRYPAIETVVAVQGGVTSP